MRGNGKGNSEREGIVVLVLNGIKSLEWDVLERAVSAVCSSFAYDDSGAGILRRILLACRLRLLKRISGPRRRAELSSAGLAIFRRKPSVETLIGSETWCLDLSYPLWLLGGLARRRRGTMGSARA
jgi:hypothetical protein